MAFHRREKYEKSDRSDRYEKPEIPSSKKRKWNPHLDGVIKDLDYKDFRFLSRFITERGKILPRRITGLSAQQQKKVTKALKRARQMSLLPFISYGA